MQLNYRLNILNSINQSISIIMIHGLFGSLSNFNTLSMCLKQYYNVIQIDLRNHGQSPHNSIMTYVSMAQDILNLIDFLLIKKCIIIGHSMGGKVAMTLSILVPHLIEKIVVIDIAPIKYNLYQNNNIFQAIDYINHHNINNRNDAIHVMENNFIAKNTIAFLLKSFRKGLWNFNFDCIKKNYAQINDWRFFTPYLGSVLFIKGDLSTYIKDTCIHTIYQQFPQAVIKTVPNSGHWVHYDHPIYVCDMIHNFIQN